MAKESFTIEAILSAQDRMTGVVSKATQSISSFGSTASRAASRASQAVSGAVGATAKVGSVTANALSKTTGALATGVEAAGKFSTKTGKAMTASGAAVTTFGVGSLKQFGDFQMSLNKAAVVAGGTSKDIGGLADVANRMGAILPISAQDAADAMIEMAQNGASLDDIKKQFPAIAQASTAAGSDLQQTAGVVQQAMNIWGNSLKSPEQAAAILVQTANASNASIEDMQQALATIGPVANQAGMDMGTTSEAVGLLTNTGMSAAQAAIDLRFAILKMLAPTKDGKAEMHKLGLSFVDAQGKMKPFPTILNEVADATAGMSKQQKIAALKTMFGTAGMQAMLPLLDSIKDKSGKVTTSWSAYAKEQQKAAGSTEAAQKTLKAQADDMQKNVGSKIEQVGGNWEALRNKAMSAEEGMSVAVLNNINKMLEWATTSNSSIASVIRSFIGLTPVIGPVITGTGVALIGLGGILKTVSGALNGVSSLFGKFGGVLGGASKKLFNYSRAQKGATSSINGTKAGLTGQTTEIARSSGAASGAVGKFASFSQSIMRLGTGIGIATTGMSLFISSIIRLSQTGDAGVTTIVTVTASLSALVAVFGTFAGRLTAGMPGILAFGKAITSINTSASLLMVSLTALVASISGLLLVLDNTTVAGTRITEVLKGVGAGAGQMMTQFLTAVMTGMPQIIAQFGTLTIKIASVLATTFPQLVQSGIKIVQSILSGIRQVFPSIISTGVAVVGNVLNGIRQVTPKVISTGLQIIASFLSGIKSRLPEILNNGMTIVIELLSGIAKRLPELIDSGIKVVINFIDGIARNMGQIMKSAINMLGKFLDALTKEIPKIIPKAVDLVITFINGISNELPKIIDAAINLIGKFIVGLAKKIPDIVDKGIYAVGEFVKGVGYAIGSIFRCAGTLISKFIEGIKQGLTGSRDAGKENAKATKEGAGSISLWSIASDMVKGFIKGIASGVGGVWGAATNLAKTALKAMKSTLKIHSPSRVFRDDVGYWITRGIGVGMMNEAGYLSKASDYLVDAATPNVPATDFSANWQGVNASVNNQVEHTFSDMDTVKQPAYINVRIGNTEFKSFVDDISKQQGFQGGLAQSFGM